MTRPENPQVKHTIQYSSPQDIDRRHRLTAIFTELAHAI